MNKPVLMTTCVFRVLAIISILLLGQGCTTITEQLFGKKSEQITPFAQKTVEVLVIENVQIRDSEFIHLHRYVDDTFVELDELQKRMRYVDLYRDKLITYSMELVRLTELHENESDRVAAYAAHIEQTVGKSELNRLGISDQEWQQILTDIRSQQTLLGALRQFQPVINRAARDFEALIKKIESEMVVAVRVEFDRRIEANYRDINTFLSREHEKRDQLLAAMNVIDEYRQGNKQAITEYGQKHTPAGKLFASATPGEKQLIEIETDLRERIKNSSMLISELKSDYVDYEKARAELDQKETGVYNDLTIALLHVTTWSQAHQALANGVEDPGEWMELSIKAAKLARDMF
jgi:hypothetical protein